MANDPDTLVLVYLRRLDARVERIIDGLADAKVRLTAVEEALVGRHRRMGRL